MVAAMIVLIIAMVMVATIVTLTAMSMVEIM